MQLSSFQELQTFTKALESRLSEQIANGVSLKTVLAETARALEVSCDEQMIVSILLLDHERKRLLLGAAPSLPDSYNDAIHGIEIGPEVGSCGTAAYCNHAIFVVDIENDRLWKDFKELALDNGLRACWSVPIATVGGEPLGTFALYYRHVHSPSALERDLINRGAEVVASLVELHRSLDSSP